MAESMLTKRLERAQSRKDKLTENNAPQFIINQLERRIKRIQDKINESK